MLEISCLPKLDPRGNGDVVQKVESVAEYASNGTCDPFVKESEVQTDVVSLGGLPLDVRIVGKEVRAQGKDRLLR